MTSDLYDAEYYKSGCGPVPYQERAPWLAFFDQVAAQIAAQIKPASVLDTGCAMGYLVERLRARGVAAWGRDISEYAIANVAVEVRAYCQVGPVTGDFGRRFDLITCIEVLEHLPKAESEKALANLCAHTDCVLFSSSPDDEKTSTHYTVQRPGAWAAQFAEQGFYRDTAVDISALAPWAGVFRRGEPRIFERYEEGLLRANRIHDEQNREIASVRAERDRLSAIEIERDHYKALSEGFARGRIMRLMRWLGGRRPHP